MIDSSKIDLFEKYLSATDYAFGSDNKPAQVSDEDKLIYQDLQDLIEAVKDPTINTQKFDSSCFDGKYVTGNVTEEYLEELDHLRNNSSKKKYNSTYLSDDVMVY